MRASEQSASINSHCSAIGNRDQFAPFVLPASSQQSDSIQVVRTQVGLV